MAWTLEERLQYVMSPYTVPPIALSSILRLLENGVINNTIAEKLIAYYIEKSDGRFKIRERLTKMMGEC